MTNTKPKRNGGLSAPRSLSFPNTQLEPTTAGVGIGYAGPPPDTPFSNPPADAYLKPTGFGTLRPDTEGSGAWWADRMYDGEKAKHEAIDILSEVGQAIYAPSDGRIILPEHKYSVVDIAGENHYIRILYITPTKEIADAKGEISVKKGDVIGYAQDLFPIYKKEKMKNHIHLELYRYPDPKRGIL